MRSFAIVSLGVLVAFPAFGLAGFAQAGFPHLSDDGTKTQTWPTLTARGMARNALELGGHLGGDYFERMEEYYKSPPKKEDFHFVDQGPIGMTGV